MAMHNSQDLATAASMVFTELRKLGIAPIRGGVGVIKGDPPSALLYSATSTSTGDQLSLVGEMSLSVHPVLKMIYDAWKNGLDYFPELSGEELRTYYEKLSMGLSVPQPSKAELGKTQFGHFISVSIGCLYAWSETKYSEAEIKILGRFAGIVDLTFRRYMELQQSEANARDAVRDASLDRVRAQIASMRTTSDLDRIIPLIWHELTILNIPFVRCGVFIMDEQQRQVHTFLSTPDGKAIAAFQLPYENENMREALASWRRDQLYITHWDKRDFLGIANAVVEQGAAATPEQYLHSLPAEGIYLHFLPFLQGMLYVGNVSELREEDIQVLQSVADAFSTAYARYEDFTRLEAAKMQVDKALSELKQAQQQLVQAEKMASLGELTAGIAHEIQNPLNFVNNFSEVSVELLQEMKAELDKGDTMEAKSIAADVQQNLEKILHHGKRADGIVKGMLQHSRSGSGQKEPVDINKLTEEYVRLAYHGLRAKDKSFNAKFETSFDPAIGIIQVISQDMGRVILNLINNAFYAVNEKQKQKLPGYEAVVRVNTRRTGDCIEIEVADNGNGIPHAVINKIFQPFFTTKPTGQGTGLGLSLSYDIVTKGHGGDLKVETTEGAGTSFIIQLPNQA
ncbi:MAG: hypothetical protein JO301_11660 [Chitinophagaceae bacterium]|nr:hypothetical protein [Chitinophagaceae bacterium]